MRLAGQPGLWATPIGQPGAFDLRQRLAAGAGGLHQQDQVAQGGIGGHATLAVVVHWLESQGSYCSVMPV